MSKFIPHKSVMQEHAMQVRRLQARAKRMKELQAALEEKHGLESKDQPRKEEK